MPAILTIPEITTQLAAAEKAVVDYCSLLSEEQFFHQPEGKWSPAQQVKHLIISASRTRLAYTLPKFMLRWYTGKPNRFSRTYDELVAKYKMKLEQGGRASGPFIPQPIPVSYGKNKMLDQFKKSMIKLKKSIQANPKEQQMEGYLAPHPLLGKITLRELGYFTIHHTYHHLESIQKMTAAID